MRRLDMSKVKEILRLKFDVGLSLRDIAASCNCGKSTVNDVLKRAQNANITWPCNLNDKEIPYLELMSRRPTALKYTGLYNQLPQILKEYLDKSDYEGKKQALKLFTKMTVATGFDTAIKAFEEGLKLGVSDPDSIWATYCRLTTGTLPEPEVPLPDTIPELKKYTSDIKIYDQLIVPGGLQL
jgi:hypothetical protein